MVNLIKTFVINLIQITITNIIEYNIEYYLNIIYIMQQRQMEIKNENQ